VNRAAQTFPSKAELLSCLSDSGYAPKLTDVDVLIHAMELALQRFGSSPSLSSDTHIQDEQAIKIGEAVRNECLSLLREDNPLHEIRRIDIAKVISSVACVRSGI